jgi:2-haloacid dehalogenase
VVFDVNETLSDMAPLADRFATVGAPRELAGTWFASLLRDGFALTATGTARPFALLARETLLAALTAYVPGGQLDDAVSHVLAGIDELDVHPDVPDGVRALVAAGRRLVTLSNGSASVAERLLTRAGLRDEFDELLSVEDAGLWKPAATAYRFALERCRVHADRAVLVACHPWDIHGAHSAGLGTAWLDRTGAPYPDHFAPPHVTISSLSELVGHLS